MSMLCLLKIKIKNEEEESDFSDILFPLTSLYNTLLCIKYAYISMQVSREFTFKQ